MKWNFETLNRRLGPWLSLGLGVVTVLILRRGVGYAPLAVGIVLGAWWLSSLLSRLLASDEDPDTGDRRKKLLKVGVRALVSGLYQNVLFFLVPLWFASATWNSANVWFPLLLAGMAVFSCFEYLYLKWVVHRRLIRTIWSSVILFATLIPAAAAMTSAPLRWFVAGSAAVATLTAALVMSPKRLIRKRRTVLWASAAAIGSAALFALVAPLLPPVPVQCVDAAIATGIQEREPIGTAEVFPAGTQKVYGWFAVTAPERYRQEVRYHWYLDGDSYGKPFQTRVLGGRKSGFRTWAYLSRPPAGDWRVELKTASGQLIGRKEFRITP